MMSMNGVWWLPLCGLLALPVAAGDDPVKAGPEPGQYTSPAKGPRLGVEPTHFDFGKALPGKVLEKEFQLRNFGSEDLAIESVSTTCGCTVAEGYDKLIKPGATTPIRIKLETRNYSGKVERSVLIKSNDPVNRRVEIRVSATVVPGS